MSVSDNLFPGTRALICRATVGGQQIEARMMVDADAYDSNEIVRGFAEDSVRDQLVREILKRWKPAIEVVDGP